jgi:hypothetical protein
VWSSWRIGDRSQRGRSALSRFCQRIREEARNRLALVHAVAAVARVQVTALFKLIELVLRHDDRPHEEATFAALSVPGNRLADIQHTARYTKLSQE